MKSDSLTKRFIAAVLVVELLCAITFSGVALWHERWARLHAFDVMLGGRSDSLLGAVQDAEEGAPGAYGVAVLRSHDARYLVEVGEVVGGPGGEQLGERHRPEPWVQTVPVQVLGGELESL